MSTIKDNMMKTFRYPDRSKLDKKGKPIWTNSITEYINCIVNAEPKSTNFDEIARQVAFNELIELGRKLDETEFDYEGSRGLNLKRISMGRYEALKIEK